MPRKPGMLRILVATLTLLLSAGVAVAANPSAASAATCSGHGCDNKDPNATGCASGANSLGSRNVVDTGIIIGVVEARYSPACGTRWVRTTSFFGVKYLQAVMSPVAGGTVAADGYYSSVWTNMLYVPLPAIACYGGAIAPKNAPTWCS
jgi:hypothetical protein